MSRKSPGARRRTIAVALDHANLYAGGFEAELRQNIHQLCEQLDLNLLLVYGRGADEPHSAAHNTIFRALHAERVDGVILVSTALATRCGAEAMSGSVERRPELPLCSVGVALPGIPSVISDERLGLMAVLEHLIEEHGARRLAFISGPEGSPHAQARLAIYRAALEQYALPFDPQLVERGSFTKLGGVSAMAAILSRDVDLDAVVAASDTLALGATEALREHGYHVPSGMPVTGFGDQLLARVANPALTTVATGIPAIAQAALHMLLEQLDGREVPECIALPSAAVIRRSCGCNPLVYAPRARESSPAVSPAAHLRQRSGELAVLLASCLRPAEEDGLREAEQLLGGLEQALYGRPDVFHRVLEGMLEVAGSDNERYRALQNAITLLRQEFRGVATLELEALWADSYGLIALANTSAQVDHRLKIDADYLELMTTGERLSGAFDLSSLKRQLVLSLPAAGFRNVFVARHPDNDPAVLEPLVLLRDGRSQTCSSARFPARLLFPEAAFDPRRRHTSMVFPLVFEAQPLGVVIFEYAPGATGYHLVRDQISAAFKTASLHQEVLTQTTLHERSVQERLSTARRIQSLSVLAGGVAHDLNNALGPLVALPDIILRELSDYERMMGDAPRIAEDIESIKSAALRASRTIKDLLTLGRQGRTSRRPVDINHTVASCLGADSLRFLGQLNPKVRIDVNLPQEPLVVRASEAQLSRAVGNLVRNAVEAIVDSGEVVVRVESALVPHPKAGYEAVEPGEYAVIRVSDTGAGIDSADLGSVFEPFFSKKRASEHSGTGLGLAIVHGVVKEHDGFVDVTSAPGQGTEFTLYLPRVHETARFVESLPVRGPSREGAKVLIVDDEHIQLRTARRVLSHLGYHVETLGSGKQAYEAFLRAADSGKSPYDLVILDMLLNEDWDGLEVFERIRQLFPEQRAIVASGHAPTERSEQAVLQGLAWLPKPYTAAILSSAVKAALSASES